MSGTTVTFDYRAKCRLSPEWAADEIARLRKERDELRKAHDDVIRTACAASNDAERALREAGLL